MSEQTVVIRSGLEARCSPMDGVWRAWAWLQLPELGYTRWVTVGAAESIEALRAQTRSVKPAWIKVAA